MKNPIVILRDWFVRTWAAMGMNPTVGRLILEIYYKIQLPCDDADCTLSDFVVRSGNCICRLSFHGWIHTPDGKRTGFRTKYDCRVDGRRRKGYIVVMGFGHKSQARVARIFDRKVKGLA